MFPIFLVFLLAYFAGEGKGGLDFYCILAFADLAIQGGVVIAGLCSVFYPLNETFLVYLITTDTWFHQSIALFLALQANTAVQDLIFYIFLSDDNPHLRLKSFPFHIPFTAIFSREHLWGMVGIPCASALDVLVLDISMNVFSLIIYHYSFLYGKLDLNKISKR